MTEAGREKKGKTTDIGKRKIPQIPEQNSHNVPV